MIKLLSVCVTQLDVRGRNKKEKFGSLVKLVTKSVDEVLVTGQKVRKTSAIVLLNFQTYRWKN